MVALTAAGLRSYIAEPERGRRDWKGKAPERDAVYANRRRIRGRRGKALLRRAGSCSSGPSRTPSRPGRCGGRTCGGTRTSSSGCWSTSRAQPGPADADAVRRGHAARAPGAAGPVPPVGRVPAAAVGGHHGALCPPRPARARPRAPPGAPLWVARAGGGRCATHRRRGFHHGLLAIDVDRVGLIETAAWAGTPSQASSMPNASASRRRVMAVARRPPPGGGTGRGWRSGCARSRLALRPRCRVAIQERRTDPVVVKVVLQPIAARPPPRSKTTRGSVLGVTRPRGVVTSQPWRS